MAQKLKCGNIIINKINKIETKKLIEDKSSTQIL